MRCSICAIPVKEVTRKFTYAPYCSSRVCRRARERLRYRAARPLKAKRCMVCDSEFVSAQPKQRYCSSRCKQRADNQSPNRTVIGDRYRSRHRDRLNADRRARIASDPEANLRERLRNSLRRKRYGKVAERLREALRDDRQVSAALADMLGYDAVRLRGHLERQFTRGMTWQRFCEGDIHIDHIRPLAMFDLTDAEEIRAAWALSNLRPLWAFANGSKGAKRTHLL
jgi:hypothetical protein